MATQPRTKIVNQFVDLDLDFDYNPVSNDVVQKINTEAIKRAVRNLVFTRKYDRFFHPEIESGVAGILFENMTPGTKLKIQTLIREVLIAFEPRVTTNRVIVVESSDGHGLDVTIEYFINNRSEPYKINFALGGGSGS